MSNLESALGAGEEDFSLIVVMSGGAQGVSVGLANY